VIIKISNWKGSEREKIKRMAMIIISIIVMASVFGIVFVDCTPVTQD
jgi:hypothetical protein